ncbi:MAG: CcdB family protein [Alphaproteobacteria bacterium]|nr:CcdB family protein [Alphaproteobacteria bacterium]
MARFDVYQYNSASVPLVIDIQADLLADLNTCVVVPLVPEKASIKEALPKLKPIIQINGENYIFMATDMGAIARRSLGQVIGNVEGQHRQDIIDAIDFLLQGF